VAPGVGHLYAGLPKRGAGAWLLTRIVGLLAAGAVIVASGWPGLAAYAAVWIGVVVAVAADAVRALRRQRVEGDAPPRWYQRPPALVIACGVVWAASIGWSMVVADAIAEHLRVRTDSMSPTVLRGERLFVAPRRGGPVQRGDLVVYKLWDTRYVKRVVGVPGDTLAMRAGVLSIDGHLMIEPYVQHVGEGEIPDRRFDWQRPFVIDSRDSTYAPTLTTWGPLVVPRANYFVLGDNRGETSDSRYNGFVPDSAVLGRPLTVYFSRDPIAGRIRWNRIGTRVGGTPLIVPTGDSRP
jgi:signal peptidase I